MNILSFDLEDWYQLIHRRITGELIPARDTVLRQADLLLELLAKHHSRATFFVLGLVAERYPNLVRRIAAQGHEIASHGYGHVRVYDLSRNQFEQDIRRSRGLLEDITGQAILGYRAPEFSINRRTLWALDTLAALGFSYDSSIFPIRHRRYGIPGFGPGPATYTLPSGRQITELPLATLNVAGTKVPVAGGGYFRLLPLWALRHVVRRHEADGQSMVTYFHPYEFDPVPLNVFETIPHDGWRREFTARRINSQNNLGRVRMREKVSTLLKEYRFTSCQEYLNANRPTANRTLLRAARAAV